MEIQKKKLILGFRDMESSSAFVEMNDEELKKKYSNREAAVGRLLLALGQYLQQMSLAEYLYT